MNHYNQYLKLGRINKDLIRSQKENLLSMASQKPVNKIKTIKADSKFTDDDYYKYNYKVFSEEKIVEINAINNLISFIKMVGIKLSPQHLQELKNNFLKNINQYNNHLRDLRSNLNFNDSFLNFEEAFDVMIKFNPDWLTIPQLNIEYYLNEDGKVVKRTKEELEERLKTETDENIKEYIQYLLTENTNFKIK